MRRTALVLGLILVGITVGSVQAAIIADSVNEFSGTQGQNNWYYGYYDRTNDLDGIYNPDSDFQQMTEFQNISTYFGPWIWSVDWANWGPGGYWTSLGALGGHPNGTNGNWGRLPNVHWPIRRWVSEVAGSITISGTFKGLDCGNVTGYIIVDGVQVWSQNVSCTAGVDYTVDATVQVDSTVDFAITPGQNDVDVNDSTEFTAVISFEMPPQRCVGGFGKQCEGKRINKENGKYSGWVSVGSIIHDNCCIFNYPNGFRCNNGGTDQNVCVDEWRKAKFHSFMWWVENGWGPYAEGQGDDIKPVPARKSEPQAQYETTTTSRLAAPSGTKLDLTDEDFCQSRRFGEKGRRGGTCF